MTQLTPPTMPVASNVRMRTATDSAGWCTRFRLKTALAAAALGAACAGLLALGGCEALGAAAYIVERDKKVEIPAEYSGLEGKTVAVVVHADMATLYEFPMVANNIATNVAGRLQTNILDIRVRDPRHVFAWQYHTPGWVTVPYGDIARELDVDRVVYIDLYEFRLHPVGNRWMWDGVCAGTVGIIERDGLDPDVFAHSYNVVAKFPQVTGVGVDAATQSQIETGLLVRFIEETSWLFHAHIRPKYENTRGDSIR